MSNFFPMPRGDRYFALAVVVVAVLALLPWSHHIMIKGLALLGWLMAALMLIAPTVALWRLVSADANRDRP